MLEAIIERFSIHAVALAGAAGGRQDNWIAGARDAEPLAYRIGRGLDTPHKILNVILEDGPVVLYRFQMSFACRVFEQSVIDGASKDIGPEQLAAVCEVHAVYEADYVVEDATGKEDEFDAQALISFGKHNVAYHVWPFFREHLHSTLSKMQIDPIVIHTLQVPKSHQKKRQKKRQKARRSIRAK